MTLLIAYMVFFGTFMCGNEIVDCSNDLPKEYVAMQGVWEANVQGGKLTLTVRERLCADFIRELLSYVRGGHPDFVQEYRELSMLIGKYVRVETFKENVKSKYALVTGIDDSCGLMVRYEDGREETLSSGEVSVKKY